MYTIKLRQLKEAARLWYDTDCDHKAATVSYYMIFAIAPLLLLSVTVHSFVFGLTFIVDTLHDWGSILGSDVLTLLSESVRNLEALSQGFGVPIFGILFFTGMVIMMFNTFTTGMHGIWGIRHRGLRGWMRKSRHSMAFVVLFEVYLFCMLALSYIFALLPELPLSIVMLLDATLFLLMTTLLLTLAFKILPWQAPPRRSCLLGGFVASVLLYVARALVALYIGVTPVPGLFGVAGLIVVLLIWIFVSSAIAYYGAAFAFVHGGRQLQ